MWEPQPDWRALTPGTGAATVGVWRAALGDRPVVIKRLRRPDAHDPAEMLDPTHFAYWRREADVHDTGIVQHTVGLRCAVAAVEEDEHGVTLTREWVEDAATSGPFRAIGMGRFAGSDVPRTRFMSRDQLRHRLLRVERRGGWPTLARTPVADAADHLWRKRESHLQRVDALPQVPQHGDPASDNLPGRDGDHVVAIDWATLGFGHVGGDLGYLSLTAREDLEPLLDAYLIGLPESVADPEDVLLGARVTAVYTALTRAEWALARVAPGEGALAGKLRHPSVAPYLRSLQRLVPHVEALLG
ncbi:phosphotransferase [Nocardioides sp. LHG3406-4]|uniref:phosphotransferase n=1 Tax=Nocardioides sp. LHG3406-4 TaxID=2804575 RepID=UPI003CF1AE87